MSKEILRFKGLSLNRDEQSAGHGELSVCAGVELHDGALRPSVLEGTMVQHDVSGTMTDSVLQVEVQSVLHICTLLYVHETASYRHFICKFGNALYWFTEDGSPGSVTTVREEHEEDVAIADAEAFIQQLIDQGISERDISYLLIDENTVRITWPTYSQVPIHTFDNGDAIISVNSVGNTLVVLAESGVHYALWKDTDYKYLGTEIPFVDINFRPSERKTTHFDYSTITTESFNHGEDVAARQIDIKPDSLFWADSANSRMEIFDENEGIVTEAIWALINQANAAIAKDGNFYAPFFVRYCYRLYDGTSLIMHSPPVFMDVALPCNYFVGCANLSWTIPPGGTHQYSIDHFYDEDVTVLTYEPNNVGIRYRISSSNANRLNSLKTDWKDIVKSIDVFVSPMMVREKSGEKITVFKEDNDVVFWGIRDEDLYEMTYSIFPNQLGFYADIPMIDKKEYLQKLKDCSTFYKLMSFNLETDTITADGTYRDLEYKKELVANITSQELMKDDYHTHCRMSPMSVNRGMYIYNHRLNLYGMNEKLFEGFRISSMINDYSGGTGRRIYKVAVELHTEEGTKYVVKDCGGEVCPVRSICNSLLFYPDSRATQMTLYFSDPTTGEPTGEKLVLKMESSNFLNGAVVTQYFYETSFVDDIIDDGSVPPDVNDLVPMRNMVITSEVDDPYYFPIEGRNTVGIGSIIGLAAVTRALSQGQVGDHDLIAFCTDGVWVMKVSSEGTYSTIHNISREVCTNAKSICQLDQSVVFATQRSLSRFVESNVVSISDMLDGPFRKWNSLFGNSLNNYEPILRQLNFNTPATDLFNSGSVFYDYAGGRVVVLPQQTTQPEPDVAMVFSIRDQTWSTMPIPAILAVVPGYPSPFVEFGDGTVMILDKPYDYRTADQNVPTSPGLVLTRELTFSDTMDVIRGYQQYADCGAAPTLFLFGSNDQINWQQLGNSNRWFQNYLPGRSFRFFRVAVFMQMKPSEEYQQLMLEVVNKYAKL